MQAAGGRQVQQPGIFAVLQQQQRRYAGQFGWHCKDIAMCGSCAAMNIARDAHVATSATHVPAEEVPSAENVTTHNPALSLI